MKRAVGILLLTIGIAGIILSVVGIAIGGRVVDRVAATAKDTLSLTSRSLDTVEASLLQTKVTLKDANEGLDRVAKTVNNFGQLVESTKPLLERVSQTVGEDVAQGIDSLRAVVSDLTRASAGVDEALTAINSVGGLLGLNLNLDRPLAEPIREIGSTLENLSREIGGLETDFNDTANKVETIGQDIKLIAQDLAVVNDGLAGFAPIIDEHVATVREIRANVDQALTGINRQKGPYKLGITIFMIWIGLTHLTPLYLGWELVTGQRNTQPVSTIQDE